MKTNPFYQRYVFTNVEREASKNPIDKKEEKRSVALAKIAFVALPIILMATGLVSTGTGVLLLLGAFIILGALAKRQDDQKAGSRTAKMQAHLDKIAKLETKLAKLETNPTNKKAFLDSLSPEDRNSWELHKAMDRMDKNQRAANEMAERAAHERK